MEKYKKISKEELIHIIQKQSEIIAEMSSKVEEMTMKVAELEERLKQNSNNSSKPPSSDGLGKPPTRSQREKTGRRPGGQKGHKGHGLKIEREPDEVVKVEPLNCRKCGMNLLGAERLHVDTRYVYDVEIKVKLTKYEIKQAECFDCGSMTVGEVPVECKGTVNYGNMTRALCVVLTNYANVGIEKTHKILRDLLGMPISGGTIKNIMREFATKTDDTIEEIKENLLKSPVLNVDETG